MFLFLVYFFFFKQKTAYEMRISDWSSDVCSSDLSAGTPFILPSKIALSLKHTPTRRVHPRRRPNRQRCAGVTHHGFRGETDPNKGRGAGLANGREADGDASRVRCGSTPAASSVLLASPSPRGGHNVPWRPGRAFPGGM